MSRIQKWFERKVVEIVSSWVEENYRVCEKSKALIPKKYAVRGEDMLVPKNSGWKYSLYRSLISGITGQEESTKKIHTPYYSPAFAPKKK